MSLAVPIVAALGLALFYSGLPLLRSDRLSSRVIPYVDGIGSSSAWSSVTRLLGTSGDPDDLKRRLAAAGSGADVASFRVEQSVWGLGGCVAVLALAGLTGSGAVGATPLLGLGVLLGFASGWVARDRLLSHAIDRRRATIVAELPSALDLMALSVMAGESLPAAIGRVGVAVGGELGRELDATIADVRAGKTLPDALHDLGARLPIAPVTRSVDALAIALEKGTPLAGLLRSQAEDLRDQARFELIAMGGKREVLMLVPVVFLIMPVVVVFALFPGLVALDLLAP